LSKLVPLHSWNGFGNPCLMVETIGQPVASANTQMNVRPKSVKECHFDGLEAESARPLRNSRRVYSDLGVRNNLMDLMAETDGNSEHRGEANAVAPKLKSANGGSSFRIGSGRFVGRGRTRLGSDGDGSVFRLRRNQSVGDNSYVCSRRDNTISQSSFVSKATDCR